MPSGVYKRTSYHIKRMSEGLRGLKYSPEAYDSRRNEKGFWWKGNKAKYWAKHGWIKKYYGKACVCEKSDETCSGRFEWSNKNHKYSRNISDWQQLCSSHHKRYDYKKFKMIPWNKGNRNNFRGNLKSEGLLEKTK